MKFILTKGFLVSQTQTSNNFTSYKQSLTDSRLYILPLPRTPGNLFPRALKLHLEIPFFCFIWCHWALWTHTVSGCIPRQIFLTWLEKTVPRAIYWKKRLLLCVCTCAMTHVGSRGQIQVISWCLYLLLPFQGSNLQQILDL